MKLSDASGMMTYGNPIHYVLLAMSIGSAHASAQTHEIHLQGSTTLKFATVDQSREILRRDDVFMRSMGPLERQLRLQADAPIEPQDYLRFAERQGLSWTREEIQKVAGVVQALRPSFARFQERWPAVIQLIKSTGLEEHHAPHCRGNAIILPVRSLRKDSASLQSLFAHELFHILSRQSSEQRAELYRIVGFELVDPIELPRRIRHRRVTNPDAPLVDCVITLRHEGEQLQLAPVLLTRQDAYESAAGTTLFGEIQFRLMPVQLRQRAWIPTHDADNGKLWKADELPAYGQTIGRNTHYIIHPEEILADNFVHLVTRTRDLPDPWVVQALTSQLSRTPPLAE